MTEPWWIRELKRQERPCLRMVLKPGDPGPVFATKIGGIPWWPKGLGRPRCSRRNHPMSFMSQIFLKDVPSLDSDNTLLSFHYCEHCALDGFMAHGLSDPDPGGYDLRLFKADTKQHGDGLRVIARSSLLPYKVGFSKTLEIQGWEEYSNQVREKLPEDYPTLEDDLDENVYPGLIHVARCKVGGWPSWVQTPEWPKCPSCN